MGCFGPEPPTFGTVVPPSSPWSVDDEPPWAGLTDRRLTVEQVRERCRYLPPPGRIEFATVENPRTAGVLVAVADLGDEAGVVITKRPDTMVHHRGDWVFPGGGMDEARDRHSMDTARREAEEELGVPAEAVEIVGQLFSRGPIPSGYILDVYVGIIRAGTDVLHDPNEVSEVATIAFSQLARDGVYSRRWTMPDHDNGPAAAGFVGVPETFGALKFFTIRDDEWLWGMQGDIAYELMRHLYSVE